jgi:hypothetical protein
MYKIYRAGPIGGCDYAECTTWRKTWIYSFMSVRAFVECISPMRGKGYLKDDKCIDSVEYEDPLSCPKGIYARDRWDALRCDLLVVNLLGARKPSLGSVMEIAWADAVGTPIIVIMEDKGNVHEHILINEACGFRVDTVDKARHLAASILNLEI